MPFSRLERAIFILVNINILGVFIFIIIMIFHFLDKWKPFFCFEDYIYICDYIQNINSFVINDKILLLFDSSNAMQTKLLNEIRAYVANTFALKKATNADVRIKTIFVNLNNNEHVECLNQLMKNVLSKYSIISATDSLTKPDNFILSNSKIIRMLSYSII